MKETTVELQGTVVGMNRGAATVELANGSVVRGIVSGKLMKNRIKICTGDKVAVEISPYDISKGRIVWRSK